jgi:hypothetical protein
MIFTQVKCFFAFDGIIPTRVKMFFTSLRVFRAQGRNLDQQCKELDAHGKLLRAHGGESLTNVRGLDA